MQPAGVAGPGLLLPGFSIKLEKRFQRTCVSICSPQPVSVDQDEQDPVGRPLMHRSALSQATGEAVYCDDLPMTDGELFMVLVTSSRAHAKIT